MRLNYTIIFVSDMKRSVSFYKDVLGLPLRFESPEWTEFASEGVKIALHIGERLNPVQEKRKNTEAGRCRPGFSVPNLDHLHHKLLSNGVPCIQEPAENFGVRIAQYLDPDGLAISVSEDISGS